MELGLLIVFANLMYVSQQLENVWPLPLMFGAVIGLVYFLGGANE